MTRILHFGPGNFFRAHLADYTQDLGGWSITAVSLQSSTLRDGLASQGNIYTLDVQGVRPRKISIIDNIIVGREMPERVLKLVSDARFPVITATVTEKGYHLRPDGHLDLSDPDIAHDLTSSYPRTLIGYLARGLAKRSAPVTVMSCDNRIGNGEVLCQAVDEFQSAAGLEMSCVTTFPNAMVDRITPAATSKIIEKTGDQMGVACEAYKEWVIENRFASTRPDWPGVEWVEDVSPYETRKLRLLNGAHSFLSYAGIMAGFTYVHEAISDPNLRGLTRTLMSEARSTLSAEVAATSLEYENSLVSRFDNIDVKHKLRQIAMDGSQKVPYRLLDSIRERRAKGLASPALNAGVLAWVNFIKSEAAQGQTLSDPRAQELTQAAQSSDPVASVLALLGAGDLTSQILE